MLKHHEPSVDEVKQHLDNASNLLKDAKKRDVSPIGRFETANIAAHALLTAAMKMYGYRPEDARGHRNILYQLHKDLIPGAANAANALERALNLRNRSEYDGEAVDITEGFLEDLVKGVASMHEEVTHSFKQFQKGQASKAEKPSANKSKPR